MKKSTLRGIFAFVVSGVIAAGVCCLGFASRDTSGKWFKNFKNISGWHWSEPEHKVTVDDEFNGGAVITDGESNGIRVARARIAPEDFASYGISPQAESAYTLTATVSPASADDTRVEWTVTCIDGSLNASEYISLNANGLTATVTCLKEFNKQFVVTVRSVDNPEATATCTLDYVQKITGVNVTMPQLTSQTGNITYTVETSVYTIASENSVQISNFQFNQGFASDLGEYLSNSDEFITFLYPTYANQLVNYTGTGIEFKNGNDVPGIKSEDNGIQEIPNNLIGCFLGYHAQLMDYYGWDEGSLISFFRRSSDYTYIGTIDVTVSSVYDGITYAGVTESVEVWIDGDVLHIPVTSLTLSNSSLKY